MAGPEQISDPRFRQFTEAGDVVDTSAATLIEGLGQAGLEAVELQQGRALRKEVAAKRDEFLKQAAGGVVDPVADLDQDDVSETFTIQSVLGSIDPDTVTTNVSELVRMEGELQAKVKAVRQGISPVRALEIETEKITRRYIDRFPGLSRQFQQIAQNALGTSNNLLSSTLRAQEELFRQAESLAKAQVEDFENMQELAVEDGFPMARFGATPEIRAQEVIRWQTKKQKEAERDLFLINEEAAAARGNVGEVQEAFNGRLSLTKQLAANNMQAALLRMLPEEYLDRGAKGIATYMGDIKNDPEALAAAQQSLAATKASVRFGISEVMRSTGAITEQQSRNVQELQDMMDAQFDVLIDSFSNKRMSEEGNYTLTALQNANDFEFETLFGRDRAFVEKFLSLIPVDSNLWNQWQRNRWEHSFAEKMIKYFETGDITSQAVGSGVGGETVDTDTGTGKALVQTVDQGAIDAFREFMENPRASSDKQYDPTSAIKGFDHNFVRMDVEQKNSLLAAIGDDRFDVVVEMSKGTDAEASLKSLRDKIIGWGNVKLQDAADDFIQDIGGPRMSQKFGIRARGGFSGPRPTALDLANMEIGSQGVFFSMKSMDELEALGIDTDPRNMTAINKMVNNLNSVHGQGLNVWAKAMGNLGRGNNAQNVLKNLLERFMREPDDS